MNVKPIRNDDNYRATLAEIESLMTARPGTAEGDRLDMLVTLVEAWERRNFPMDLSDPVGAIERR